MLVLVTYDVRTSEPGGAARLRRLGAAIEKPGLATTSSMPRYALRSGFAALFDPALTDQGLADAIAAWQAKSLTKGALARIAIVRRGGAAGGEHVTVTFPNGQTLRMKPGPSSEITKAVIEVFAPGSCRNRPYCSSEKAAARFWRITTRPRAKSA